ncbi:MAG: aspartate--tRNA ligase [Planctomycetota bacterium]
MTTAAPSPTAEIPYRRTHHCNELRPSHVGEHVTLAGWVNSYRDHGVGLVFIDLRDRNGITQVVFDRETASDELLAEADKLRAEDCIAVTGPVRTRDGGPNPKLATGEIEVVAESLVVLSEAENPPFQPGETSGLPNEELRLKHRYLDLRRPAMQRILHTRSRAAKVARDFFHGEGFLEVETPILCKSTPEGARDFLVPSRLTPGSWYALPQSPQLFKQILMMSGCDRYMQICKCFRDEDLRADRQPEFTQIDLEMSFVGQDDVIEIMTRFLRGLWRDILGVEIPTVDHMPFHEAMDRYGSDRPDRRVGLELVDVSDLAAKTDFKVFTGALEKRAGVVKVIRVPGGAEKLTRKLTDGYTEFVKQFGAGGVPTTKVVEGGFEAGIGKFIEPIREEVCERLGAHPGDQLLFGADTYATCSKALGELRLKVAKDLDLFPTPESPDFWNFLWVTDFPMFEFDEETQRFYAMHHPFTAPRVDQIEAFLAAEPGDRDTIEGIASAGYDLVCNGSEIAGGSIRIHQSAVQQKVFELLGISADEANEKFSFLMDALKYGPPPHGGIAWGFDRLIMHLAGTDNIRDVIAFPKTQTGADVMCESPSPVDEPQLGELHVKSTWEGEG